MRAHTGLKTHLLAALKSLCSTVPWWHNCLINSCPSRRPPRCQSCSFLLRLHVTCFVNVNLWVVLHVVLNHTLITSIATMWFGVINKEVKGRPERLKEGKFTLITGVWRSSAVHWSLATSTGQTWDVCVAELYVVHEHSFISHLTYFKALKPLSVNEL